MNKSRIYMDYNATAPLLPQAREAMLAALDLPGNPSSVHAEGRLARSRISTARRQVAALVGAPAAHVTFTSGATEAAATLLSPHYKMGKADLFISHLYVSAVEHPCVLAGGHFAHDEISTIKVDHDGIVDLAHLTALLEAHDRSTGLPMVAVQMANNETGICQPVSQVAEIVNKAGGILVVDAVQAAGRMPIDMSASGIDFLFISSHKLGGPKGAGAIVSAGEIMMPKPLIPGGGQEKGHRSGTENPPAICGFGAACAMALENLSESLSDIGDRRDALEGAMRASAPDCIIYGQDQMRLVNTIFFCLPGLKAETAQISFDLEGIAVSAGSACSSGKVGPSHVLAAMGRDTALGGVRVSIGSGTSAEDVNRFLAAFEKINSKRLDQLLKKGTPAP
ncbi:MAG: cysteine desulfurase family protein [Rhizobiaceae bacterium]|nr:cysteine desulfurase family protein [Rhizobiaceae bacterium]